MLRVGEFFAGIGGFRIALERLSPAFQVVFANDIDARCKVTYDANFAEPKLTVGDLRDLDAAALPDMDVVVGGFPCQPFSRKGLCQAFADDRGQLFFTLAAVIRAKQPRWVLLENVKNLVHVKSGSVMTTIVATLQEMGYAVRYRVLDTAVHTALPQHRERVFIFASKIAAHAEALAWPPAVPPEARRPIQELLEQGRVADRFYYGPATRAFPLLDATIKELYHFHLIWTCSRIKPRFRGVSPTLVAHMGLSGNSVPVFREANGIRKLTPRECFRLQGFPDAYVLPDSMCVCNLYAQIGNAVTTDLVERLLRAVVLAVPI
jgi:DNA (cytosine-5)-methyltransferase 1